jgi:hypothetical protein
MRRIISFLDFGLCGGFGPAKDDRKTSDGDLHNYTRKGYRSYLLRYHCVLQRHLKLATFIFKSSSMKLSCLSRSVETVKDATVFYFVSYNITYPDESPPYCQSRLLYSVCLSFHLTILVEFVCADNTSRSIVQLT